MSFIYIYRIIPRNNYIWSYSISDHMYCSSGFPSISRLIGITIFENIVSYGVRIHTSRRRLRYISAVSIRIVITRSTVFRVCLSDDKGHISISIYRYDGCGGIPKNIDGSSRTSSISRKINRCICQDIGTCIICIHTSRRSLRYISTVSISIIRTIRSWF